MSPLSQRAGEIFVTALVFGAMFAAGGAGSFLVYGLWIADPGSVDEFVHGFVVFMFAFYIALFAVIAGAVTGALHAMMPRRARDAWMAMAIGAGVVLTGLTFSSFGRSPPVYVITPVILAAILSALCAWITRNFGKYE